MSGLVGLGTDVDSSSVTVVVGVSATLRVVVGKRDVPTVKAVVDVSARCWTTAAAAVFDASPAKKPANTPALGKLVIMADVTTVR